MNRVGIKPDWVEDLLVIWAVNDAVGAAPKGLTGACPMFKLWGVVDDDRAGADDSYTELEVEALRSGLEQLKLNQPDAYDAILAAFKPWSGLVANDSTHALAISAGEFLAEWVDAKCG